MKFFPIVFLCISSALYAGEKAELLKMLGDKSYTKREYASKTLMDMDDLTEEDVLKAMDTDDIEITLRARSLLRHVRERNIWEAKLWSYSCDEKPLYEAMEEISEMTGYKLRHDTFRFPKNKPITVNIENKTFYALMREFCIAADAHLKINYDTTKKGGDREVSIAEGSQPNIPVAHAGPFELSFENARRYFSQDINFEDGDNTIDKKVEYFGYLMYEPKVNVIAYMGISVVNYEMAGEKVIGMPWDQQGSSYDNGSRLHKRIELRLDLPLVDKIEDVELATDVIVAYDREDFDIPFEEGKHHTDHGSITITSIKSSSNVAIGGTYEVKMVIDDHDLTPPIVGDWSFTDSQKPAEIEIAEKVHQFTALSADHKKMLYTTIHRLNDGVYHITLKFSPVSRRNSQGELISKPEKLIYSRYGAIARKKVKFKFNELKVPAASP